MNKKYIYIWEYEVEENNRVEFERMYKSDGEWVKLFKKGEGHIRTELCVGTEKPGRYMTIDYWESQEACMKFREEFKKEFYDMDEECEKLTVEEKLIGNFFVT